MGPPAAARRSFLLGGIVAGLLVLAAGVTLAGIFLPEWRQGQPREEAFYRERFRVLAGQAGFSLEPGVPGVRLATRGPEQFETFRSLGDEGEEWLLANRAAIRVQVVHGVRGPGAWGHGRLVVDFSFDGVPQLLIWSEPRLTSPFKAEESRRLLPLADRVAPLLLAPGERLGPRRQEAMIAFDRMVYPIQGGKSRQEHLSVFTAQTVLALRQPGGPADPRDTAAGSFLDRTYSLVWREILSFLALAGLFVILLGGARISVGNGFWLTLAALLTLRPGAGIPVGPEWLPPVLAGFVGLRIFLLWSCGESLLRSADPSFTTSLDALLAARLGPRGGRALVTGFGFGAGLAGLGLALLSLARVLPGVWLERASPALPLFRAYASPVAAGITLAGGVALVLAFSMRLVPLRWVPAVAALAAALLFQPLPVRPFPAGLAASVLFTGPLVWILRRFGLTVLLTASLVSFLLPAAAFSLRYLDWLGGSFAATACLAAVLLLLGVMGLSRPAAAESQRLAPPGFVRRLEMERRMKHEMGLLAAMQRGLLPRTLPRVEGYELAARSVIANEAGGDLYDVLPGDDGRLWIAAGDVAGHGYSCAIALAMTKAALASLVGRGRTPAEVLGRADRVLRAAGVGAARNFTALTLLRLDPETGDGLLSNAGHPYPLLFSGGEVTELAMPGLPLGMGPPRTYENFAVRLPPGGILLFYSDGLFEAADAKDELYGFEPIREVLRGAVDRPADQILEALLADWRRHLRSARLLDDTTVLVLKRRAGAGAGS